MSLYAVYLRQPAGIDDERREPFWEFGSFGRTGCHRRNLLSRNSPLEAGDQLAFLQGGNAEVRIVAVTPPLHATTRRESSGALQEVNWDASYRPLPYESAPLLIDNQGRTEFPSIVRMIVDAARSTWCSKLGSCFRSRTSALDEPLAREILAWFATSNLPRALHYTDAIMRPGLLWHAHATKAGWGRPAARRLQYQNLGGVVDFKSTCQRST